ncbi:MAG: hypothetical protein M3Y57_16120 [Acidobacteriota bacterium]|nr:hypothetical protein [Acidobacteriota bacterium]
MPLLLICVLFAAAKKNKLSSLAQLCKATILFGLTFLAFGILFSSSRRFESVAEIQPMRAFHSIYVVFSCCWVLYSGDTSYAPVLSGTLCC